MTRGALLIISFAIVLAAIERGWASDDQENSSQLPVEVIPGAFLIPMRSVISYEGSFPISFNVDLPVAQTASNMSLTCKADSYMCQLQTMISSTYAVLQEEVSFRFQCNSASFASVSILHCSLSTEKILSSALSTPTAHYVNALLTPALSYC